MHVFDLIHDLQWLRAKSALVPLDDAEQSRLNELVCLLRGDEDEEPTLVRLLRPLPCHLALPGPGFVPAEVRVVSADGFVLVTGHVLNPDDVLTVHIDALGVTYTFRCRVLSDTALGLIVTFEGVPTRQRESAA